MKKISHPVWRLKEKERRTRIEREEDGVVADEVMVPDRIL